MIFQWYLFVLIFAVGFVATYAGQRQSVTVCGRTEIHYNWLPVLCIMIPMIYWAAIRKNLSFGDTDAYKSIFARFPSSISGISGYLATSTKDKGFSIVSIIVKSIIGNRVQIYFGIIAAVTLFCVFRTYKKYSGNFIFSIFLFVASGEYVQWEYNGIRQFIAVAVIFACTGLMLRHRYIALIIIILLMSTIHQSALLMLPVIFIAQGKAWNYRTVLFCIAVVFSIAYLDHFTNIITSFMESSQYSNEVDQFLSTEGTNGLRVLVFAIPPLLSLIFRRYINQAKNPLINLSVNMSIIAFGMYVVSMFTSGIYIGRLPIYFSLYNYMLLPWIYDNVFTKTSAKYFYAITIILYMIFYYYQIVVTWGL